MKRFTLLLSFSLGVMLVCISLIPLQVFSQNPAVEDKAHSIRTYQHAPIRIGQVKGTGFGHFAINANWAYVNVGGGTGYRLAVMDISSPTQPVSVTTLSLPSSTFDIEIQGTYAYLATYQAGLQIVDISNPIEPMLVGAYSGDWSARDLAVAGSYAYVAAYNDGMRIIDISNPMMPTEVNVFDSAGFAWSVTTADSYLYLIDVDVGEIPPISALRIFTLTNPITPTQVGQYNQYDLKHVSVNKSLAYLTFSYLPAGGGLEIVDVSNPTTATFVGRYCSSYWLLEPVLHESKVFVPGLSQMVGIGELFEFDVLTPTVPTLVSTYFTPSPSHVEVDGKYVYLSDTLEGFSVLLNEPNRGYLPLLVSN